MNIKGLSVTTTVGIRPNEYLYNGKMMQDEMGLNWLDYGARFYDPVLGRWHSPDLLAEKYLDLSPYTYVGDNPILRIDLFGLDWYTDKDKSYQYDPNVNKKTKLSDGQKYVGKTYAIKDKNGKVTTNYRKDGSIVFNSQKDAYNRMVDQEKKVDREQFGVIDKNKVTVLPDYLNTSGNAFIEEYGYKFKDGKFVDKDSGGIEEFIATIHTHPGNSLPSTYMIYDFGDLETAAYFTPGKMMVILGVGDKSVSGLYSNGKVNAEGRLMGKYVSPNRTYLQILSGCDLRTRLIFMNNELGKRK